MWIGPTGPIEPIGPNEHAQWVPNGCPLVTIGHVENLKKCSMMTIGSIGPIQWAHSVGPLGVPIGPIG